MMRKTLPAILVGIALLGLVVGCGSSATPTPAPTLAPVQITVIVTATPPPATDTPSAPTITPLPTIGVTTTVPAAPTSKPTTAPKPAATKKPAVPVATATATAAPLTRNAPVLIGPDYDPGIGRKDERHTPADALIFQWQSIGPLGPNECYMIRVDFVPGAGDSFLQCDPQWTQKAAAQTTQFILYQPGRGGPNYSGLLPNPPTDLTVKWYVTVVRDLGAGVGPVDPVTGTRHKVVPESPASSVFQFLLKAG